MKKYSKKWMQTFVDGQLPTDDDFILTQVSKKGFEVEGFEKTPDDDSLFEIKVLKFRILQIRTQCFSLTKINILQLMRQHWMPPIMPVDIETGVKLKTYYYYYYIIIKLIYLYVFCSMNCIRWK